MQMIDYGQDIYKNALIADLMAVHIADGIAAK